MEKKDVPVLAGFFVMLGALILLIASANVANMMLARAAGRGKEIAMRLALGAGRGRLIRQLLSESMLVSVAAGAFGFLLAEWLMRLASQIRFPYPMPLSWNLMPDRSALLVCFSLAVVTGLAFGLVPALQATRTDLTPALKESGNVQLFRRRRTSVRNALMVSQVSASLALLLVTGFLVIGARRVMGGSVGFDADRVAVLSLDPVRDGYSPQRTQEFFGRLLDRVKLLPEVASVALADDVPMTAMAKPVARYAAPGETGKMLRYARRYTVSSDFFETMGIVIVRGRALRKQDETDDAVSAVVSERLVRQCWPGLDPIGKRIEIGGEEPAEFRFAGGSPVAAPAMGKARTLEVVGVARNVRDGLVAASADAPATIYTALGPADYGRPPVRGMTPVVRGASGADAIAAVRREIAALDDRITPFDARPLADHIEEISAVVRAGLYTYCGIGVFGLILASVGLAGVTAYTVTQRRREIGIRIAIGATGGAVRRMVMKEGLMLVAIGSAAGLAGAQAGVRALGSVVTDTGRMTGTSASDPALLAGAPLVMAAVALAACYVPARASSRIDPVETLRQE